jgi:hypothetical protein
MAASSRLRRVSAVAVILAALPLVSAAQKAPKPPPRLPPTASQTSQIPGGTDTGTPGGSDSVQLGTPVMSNSMSHGSALKGGSAAARAAARPKAAASSADCTKPVVPSKDENKAIPAVLPKPGIIGKATSPPAAAKTPVAPGSTRIDC